MSCDNHQPTGHQMSRQGLYVPKVAYFGAKMAVFGPHILIILGGSKGSGTYISENHLGTLFELSFWSDMAPKESERPVFGPKWPKMHIVGLIWLFLGQNPIFFGEGAKVLVLTYQKTNLTPLSHFFSRFCKKKPADAPKKSSPTPLWGHRLPVPALARGLDEKKWRSFNSRSRSAVFLLSSCDRCRSSVTALRSWTNSYHFISTILIWQENLCIFCSREYFSVGTQF